MKSLPQEKLKTYLDKLKLSGQKNAFIVLTQKIRQTIYICNFASFFADEIKYCRECRANKDSFDTVALI